MLRREKNFDGSDQIIILFQYLNSISCITSYSSKYLNVRFAALIFKAPKSDIFLRISKTDALCSTFPRLSVPLSTWRRYVLLTIKAVSMSKLKMIHHSNLDLDTRLLGVLDNGYSDFNFACVL